METNKELLDEVKRLADEHPGLQGLLDDYRTRKRVYDEMRGEDNAEKDVGGEQRSERRYRTPDARSIDQ